MNELELANLTEEILETEEMPEEAEDSDRNGPDDPQVKAFLVSGEGTCKYRFKFTAKKTNKNVASGKLTFKLNTKFIDPLPIGQNLKIESDGDGEWDFGELQGNEEKTIEFDTTYVGDAIGSIDALFSMAYDGKFVGGGGPGKTDFDGDVNPVAIKLNGVPKCPMTPQPKPPTGMYKITADAQNKCLYHFEFTLTRQGNTDVDGGTLTFTLASVFNIGTIMKEGMDTLTGSNPMTWTFGELNQNKTTRTLKFDATYVGAADVGIIIGTVPFTGDYETGGKFNGVATANPGSIGKTREACTPPPVVVCCEPCDIPVTAYIDGCEDHKEVEVDPRIKSKGRVLAVNVDLPQACKNKDINVGIFVTEVFNVGQKGEYEKHFAFKIIRRVATDPTVAACQDNRDCNCVNFLIDDDDTTKCAKRTFRIKTEAHYVAREKDTNPKCECGCPPSVQG